MAKTGGDKRANNGGKRKGAGRKPKADEETKNNLFVEAVKKITCKDDEDDAKIDLLVDLWDTQRGKIFIAEHIFGKPKEQLEVTNKNQFPDLSNITTDELENLLNAENDNNS